MLNVEDLVKSYGGGRRSSKAAKAMTAAGGTETAADGTRVLAVDGVNFEVAEGELFTLLGPSGCGKTTTLRSIAGLERPNSGRITLSSRVLFDGAARVNVPANRRELGMVFQSYAIWPHMTVFRNVSFPLDVLPRSARPRKAEITERVERALEVTELSGYAGRAATKLSGGQQQRLALARALVIQPDLMLLDEPLSNLDAKLRENMRFELKRLQRELGLTAIYVTHDQSEALVMSSRIAVMNAGRIEQVGKPREVYSHPASRFVAEFIGTSNFMSGIVSATDDEEIAVDTAEGRVVSRGSTVRPAVGADVVLSVRPEDLDLSADPARGGPNEWEGQVLTRAYLGDAVDHVVGVSKLELRTRSNPTLSIEPGTRVRLCVDPAKVTIVPNT